MASKKVDYKCSTEVEGQIPLYMQNWDITAVNRSYAPPTNILVSLVIVA